MTDAQFLKRELGIDFYLARSKEEDTPTDTKIAELLDLSGGLDSVFFAPAERGTQAWTAEREAKMRTSIIARGKTEATEAGSNMKIVYPAEGDRKREVVNIRWNTRKRGPKTRQT